MSLPSAAVHTAVTVPRDVLVIRQNHSYVLRVKRANAVEELDVTPGAGIANVVEVRAPLAAGDRLAIRGGERLASGRRCESSTTRARSRRRWTRAEVAALRAWAVCGRWETAVLALCSATPGPGDR